MTVLGLPFEHEGNIYVSRMFYHKTSVYKIFAFIVVGSRKKIVLPFYYS